MKSNPSNPGFVLYLIQSPYYSNSVRWQDFAVTINFIGGRRIPEAAESYNDTIQINFYRLSLSRNTSTIIRTNQFWRFLKSHKVKVTILGSNTNNIHIDAKRNVLKLKDLYHTISPDLKWMLFTEGTIKFIYFWTKFLTFKLSTCTDNAPKVSNRNTISVADIASTSCQYMLKPF